MVELAFLTTPQQNWFFRDLVATLRDELDRLGVPSSESDNGFPEPRENRVFVVVPPHEYVALEGEGAFGNDQVVLDRTIFICAEQPESVHFEVNVELSRRAGAVFDISAESVRLLRRRGVLAEHLPVGYSPRWDHYLPASNRQIDIAFMGCRTERRTRYLSAYSRVFARRTCHLQLSDNSTPNFQASPTFLAENKWELLTSAKVLINLHQAEEPYFEWMRALDAIHSGCVLVSEHSTGYEPLQPGRHFFAGAPQSLAFIADRILGNDALRTEVAGAAYELIRDRQPTRRAVQRLVAVASRLAKRPVPRRTPERPLIRPVLTHRGAADPGLVPIADNAMRRALKDVRLDTLEMRRELTALNLALRSPAHVPAPRVREVATTSAWLGRRASRVTVVTALYNHSREIIQALGSVAASYYADLEVVVVNDGSTDDSAKAVLEWIRAHDHIAALLVEHPINRGLGHARNTALDFARGEYCLILDADNMIYPRCLLYLVAMLDQAPALAFAYPMLEVFNHVETYVQGGGDYLMSQWAWDPMWLRTGNTVDALALIRTSVLRELGGYAVDRRLHGYEDFDLWCRMAERGLAGSQVAQAFARYRASPSSMLSLSGISLTGTWVALAERSPKLFEGIRLPI